MQGGNMYKIFLASKSPRRKELMTQVGYEFEILVSDREEKISGNNPQEVVKELSMQKAYEIEHILLNQTNSRLLESYRDYDGVVIIGADTVVAYEGAILGKPVDDEDAFNMLKMIQGNTHVVSTGVTMVVMTENGRKTFNFAESTNVNMYDISDDEIREYISTGEGRDKAGSYAIQGIGAKFIKGIEGDYNNVVGLPIGRIYQTLKTL